MARQPPTWGDDSESVGQLVQEYSRATLRRPRRRSAFPTQHQPHPRRNGPFSGRSRDADGRRRLHLIIAILIFVIVAQFVMLTQQSLGNKQQDVEEVRTTNDGLYYYGAGGKLQIVDAYDSKVDRPVHSSSLEKNKALRKWVENSMEQKNSHHRHHRHKKKSNLKEDKLPTQTNASKSELEPVSISPGKSPIETNATEPEIEKEALVPGEQFAANATGSGNGTAMLLRPSYSPSENVTLSLNVTVTAPISPPTLDATRNDTNATSSAYPLAEPHPNATDLTSNETAFLSVPHAQLNASHFEDRTSSEPPEHSPMNETYTKSESWIFQGNQSSKNVHDTGTNESKFVSRTHVTESGSDGVSAVSEEQRMPKATKSDSDALAGELNDSRIANQTEKKEESQEGMPSVNLSSLVTNHIDQSTLVLASSNYTAVDSDAEASELDITAAAPSRDGQVTVMKQTFNNETLNETRSQAPGQTALLSSQMNLTLPNMAIPDIMQSNMNSTGWNVEAESAGTNIADTKMIDESASG